MIGDLPDNLHYRRQVHWHPVHV